MRLSESSEKYLYIIISVISFAFVICILSKRIFTSVNDSTIISSSMLVETGMRNISFLENRDPIVVDYDSVQIGRIYRFEFVVHNSGYKPIIIKDIIKTCSCTGYILSKKILDINDTLKLNIFFNARERIGIQTIGLGFNIQGDTIPQYIYLRGKIYY